MSVLDGMTFPEAIGYLIQKANKETDVESKVDDNVKYMHLRIVDLNTGEISTKGGVTLAYTQDGDWYKVGAAFCGLKDTYQKAGYTRKRVSEAHWSYDGTGKWYCDTPAGYDGQAVGTTLAKMRLEQSPLLMHKDDFESGGATDTVLAISNHNYAGRFWVERAMNRGLGYYWELRTIGQCYGIIRLEDPFEDGGGCGCPDCYVNSVSQLTK